MRALVVVAACAAVAVVGWVWFAGANQTTVRSRRSDSTEIERPAAPKGPTGGPVVEELSGVVDEDRVQLTGSIVLVDAQGVEHTKESGQFRLRVWEESTALYSKMGTA